jgi:ubiquinone biosynthesis protein
MRDYSWISETALEAKNYSSSLGAYFAKAISKVSFDPISDKKMKHAWAILARDIIHFSLDANDLNPSDIDETISALQTMGMDQLNQEILNEEKLNPIMTQFFDKTFGIIGQYPTLFDLLEEREIIGDIVDTISQKYIPLLRLFPAFSSEALGIVPYLREPLFTALYEMPDLDHHKLTRLTEKLMGQFYSQIVRPELVMILQDNLKGKNLLLPLIDEAVSHLPADKCMTTLISILCTPKNELTQGRIISIVLQELGGIYVKLSQVLAELAPPHLAKELKHQQDKLGGIFGSQYKSWNYVLEIFKRPSWERLKHYIHIPDQVQNAFAGASVGAIYEFELTEMGKKKLHTQRPVLIKVQRPELSSLFESQKNTLLSILSHLEKTLPDTELNNDEQSQVEGLISALKRTIINYAAQSLGELDFRLEKKNAEMVREALKGKFNISIPHYYHVESDILMMEKIEGEKITSVVHTRYLERMSIADTVSDAYLHLMFKSGIIWADPHAGNILYDPDHQQVKLIDLNPCFTWDSKRIKIFISFLYRLILSDQKGIFESLRDLVENPDDLKNERTKQLIQNFISGENQGAFIRYLSDFVRLLGEANINLRIEVLAALRGITQVYLTSIAISSRHNFGQIFQKQFGWKMLIRNILSIGPFKVAKALLPIAFDLVKNSPEQEVGPTLDERDISAIQDALVLLNDENVCNIELLRMSPEENTRLSLSTDGSHLIKSVHLKIDILTETKPASVRYLLEVPSKEWLKDRQEYVKLQGMGLALCLVECLEQLRRHSLEDYWYVVEGWNNHQGKRTYKESTLIGDVRLAARDLFARRYENIWTSELMTVSRGNRLLWKLLIWFEKRFEKRETGYFYFLSKKMGSEKVGQYTFGTLHSIKIITYRLII